VDNWMESQFWALQESFVAASFAIGAGWLVQRLTRAGGRVWASVTGRVVAEMAAAAAACFRW
jgi:hypothetical protein